MRQKLKAQKLAARSARAPLETWTATAEFRRRLAAIADDFGRAESITVSYLGWYKDAWMALKFAEKTSSRYLRLCPQVSRGADFEVRLRSGCTLPFQCVEAGASVEGKRGNVYRQWKEDGWAPRPDPEEDWLKRRRAIPQELEAAINNKISKGYTSQMNLLIYLPLGTYETWVEEVEADLVTFSQGATGKFRSVWVLWSGRLYRCVPNPSVGRPGSPLR
jgi:hypothetical protein